MAGYLNYSGVMGGQGSQQAGSMPQSPQMFSQQQPQSQDGSQGGGGGAGGFVPGMSLGGTTLQSNPAAQAQLQNNSTNVPGFGYLNNQFLTGHNLNGNFLSNPMYANATASSMNALNVANGGNQFGTKMAGSGFGQGGVDTYGVYTNTSGQRELGDNYTFGGKQYSPIDLQGALTNFSSLLGIPDYAGMGTNGGAINWTGPFSGSNGHAQSIADVYQFLQANQGLRNYGNGNFGTAQGAANPFASYFNDMSSNYGAYATPGVGANGGQLPGGKV